jgi:predicted MFS family arabinose efflux permease
MKISQFGNCIAMAFLVMFQAYLVAPVISEISNDLHSSLTFLGLTIPAFAVPYGFSALIITNTANRFGKKHILVTFLFFFTIVLLCIARCNSIKEFIFLRILAGIFSGPLIPICIIQLADGYNLHTKNKIINYIFLSMATGMTMGPIFGAYFNTLMGWRNEFMAIAVISTMLLVSVIYSNRIYQESESLQVNVQKTRRFYWRNILYEHKKTYSFIYLNGIFHSGIFVWTSNSLTVNYQLNDQGIAIALFGFGVPGLVLAFYMANAVKKIGMNRIIPVGVIVVALTTALLLLETPVWIAVLVITLLSIAFVLTFPLFIGMFHYIKTSPKRDESISLGFCALFLGYGSGPLVLIYLIRLNVNNGLLFLSAIGLMIAWLAIKLFKKKSKADK